MTGGEAGLHLWVGAGLLILATALTAGLIVLLRPWLVRYALARPNVRSSHREPTPQGGGIAVIAATILTTVGGVLLLGDADGLVARQMAVVLAATAFIAVVGGVDDLRPLPVAPRFLLQTLAAVAVLAVLPSEFRVSPAVPWWAERVCLLVALLWFINLVNFMDGIDWITVAEVVPLTASLVLLGALGRISPPATILALALLGAMLGFAPFNKPVAKLFLGDVGSLPIGLLLGWLLLTLAAGGEAAAALLLPLYYLADASVTLARRIVAGETFWQAHRSHFYQRAGDMGFSVTEIVARVFAVNVVLAALALLTIAWHTPYVIAGSLLAGALLVAWLLARFSRKNRG
jgi:UDP-N-acetylmuramyl pentapeptide phosphotransferase/UDP-N-acetylglucosamine-1-phosphate transferase